LVYTFYIPYTIHILYTLHYIGLHILYTLHYIDLHISLKEQEKPIKTEFLLEIFYMQNQSGSRSNSGSRS